MIAQQSCSIYLSDNSETQGSQKLWIRIIYILERIQLHTEYCCSSRISGWAGQGCQFAKWLQRNETQKSSIAGLSVLLNKLTPLVAVRSV